MYLVLCEATNLMRMFCEMVSVNDGHRALLWQRIVVYLRHFFLDLLLQQPLFREEMGRPHGGMLK